MRTTQDWDKVTLAKWPEIMRAHDLANHHQYEEAETIFRDLSRQGSIYAKVFLAHMIEKKEAAGGQDLANKLFEEAAQTGNLYAQFQAATFCFRSDNFAQAYHWARESADEGYVPSIYLMGKLYRAGLGCEANFDYYKEYNEFAAKEGHVWARRRLYLDMICGKYGVLRIPIGLFQFISWLPKTLIVSYKTPDAPELQA